VRGSAGLTPLDEPLSGACIFRKLGLSPSLRLAFGERGCAF